MIRKVIPLLFLFLGNFVSAQVGIGTKEPNPASALDIVAKDKGILLPRIQLKSEQDKSAIVNPEESLLVYNTGSTSLVAGFYYWRDARWTQLLSGDNYIDTKNQTFTIEKDSNNIESLVITDTQGGKVFLAISAIAKNNTFVTNLVENQEFITKLGDNIEFVNHITNNEDFITNIVNELKGKYGNVNYNPTTNTFVYYDEHGAEHDVDWSALNTTNVSFTLVNDKLVVTDSEQNVVELAVTDIASNKTFVEHIATNQDFITKLGDNLEFINHITNNEAFVTNIVNTLKGKYGNVNYNPTTNTFVYYDEHGAEHDVDWSALNTTNVSFTLVNDKLVVTDSEQNVVELAVTDIASNKTFVEHIATNQDFITKLGDNLEFINHITNNEAFVTNIVNTLKGKYGNVNYNPTTNTFVYYDEHGAEHDVDWSALNTTNVSFTLVNDKLVVTDSEQNVVELAVTDIASNKTFVEHIATNQDFITKLGDNLEFVNHITSNEDFITNVINTLKGKYGNVNYNPTTNTFVYYDEHGVEHEVDWSVLNTTNVSFTLVNDKLVVTDLEQNVVELAVTDIANNKAFVEQIATNQDFITKLGDNATFITTIVDMLKDKYGNVGFDVATNSFFYYDADYNVVHISWESLGNTKIKSFTIDEVNNELVITDTEDRRFPVTIDDLGRVLANNDVFVTNLVNNKTFTTKLGNDEHFVTTITNNEDFITNVINTLKGKYGNVNYNPTTNTFVYYDEHGAEHDVDWSALNTTNVSFTLVNDKLVVTDSEQNVVELAVTDIASNKTFVEHIATNQDFITKLGDNLEFINHITNNEAFVTNIVNTLKGKYGNVNYNPTTNTFVYYDEHGAEHDVDWSALNTTNVSFTLVNDKLVVTDSEQNVVELAVTDIASNKTFVEHIATNQDFITKLGDNLEFINHITNNEAFVTNIVNTLKGKYGNVNYNPTTNTFVYYDEHGAEHDVDWSALNTTNVSFTLVNDKLVVTDSEQNVVELAVTDIASNKTFVEHIATNQDFITKLGDNLEFINHITNNEAFVTNIVNTLKGKYGNVNYNPTTNTFVYYDEHGAEHDVDWSALNTTNVSFTLVNDKLVVTDSEQNVVELAVTDIASNKTFVEHIATNQDFITKLGDNLEFINHITNNEAFVTNIVNTLKGKYGNVNYNPTTNTFVYYDEHGAEHDVDWSALNTTNVSFTLVNDKLVVTDSEQNVVELAVTDIASNKTFVEHIATNQDFITKLGDNLEFINHITNNEAFVTNIVNTLKGKYGNVNYNPTTNTFVYYDEHGAEHDVDWSALNTTNVSFTLVNDKLVVTDSEQNVVELAVTDIASNKTFVEHIATNQDFITKLGDNTTFITTIVDKLKGKYGNVGFDADTQKMFYYDENYTVTPIEWEDIVSAAETLTALTSSNADDKALLIYEDENNVENKIDLVAVLQGSPLFETYLKDYISSVSIEETTTKLNRIETGLYEYLNEEAVKNGTAGVKITVTQDVIDDFETIVDNEDVLSILTTIINNTAGDVSVEKVGEDIVIKNKAGLIVNLTEEIQEKETKTWLEHVKRREVEETPSGDIEYFVHSIKYHGEDSTDQRNQEILISELIKGSETITELDYNVQTGELIYTNEVETKTMIPLDMLVKQFETKTELIIDQDAKKLIYQGENSRKEIDLAPVIQEPWLQVATQTGATNSNQDMYVNGWVGIGYDKPSGTVNEKLRVNGSITATNSYYADYVFEKYFTGESELKYDYVFNDLNTVASFIKNNRHLPGITPISELEKGEGGYSFNVSELSIQLLEKTEELYLHIIEQANKISELEKQNEELKELEQEFEKVKQDSQSKNETLLLLVQKIEELEQTVNALKK
ncbi:hypothetical protein [Myroides odoratus]|uniref:hypothetical protein n=1 Tax=Myroides odoratus TaxID=256 RepID=UPI003340DBF8